MKKIISAFILSILAWLLFYGQLPGINVLIAQILISAVVILYNYRRLNTAALSLWAMTIAASVSVLIWGSFSAAVFNFILWILLLVQLHYPDASLFFSAFHGLITLIGFPLWISESESSKKKSLPARLIISVSISVIVIVVFFIYYRSTNQLFDLMIQKIPFPEISAPAIRFWIISFLVILGLSTPRLLDFFQKTEDKWKQISVSHSIDAYILIAAWVLFGGLNLVLAGMNATDIYYLFFSKIPEEVSYSYFLHQSVNASIVSILMAIALIVWMQRQGDNKEQSYGGLKFLLYLWLAQNVLLALLSFEKNLLYVTEYGLTHKRIGVFVYLSLCISGLLLTTWMFFRKQNAWFLVRANTWAVLGIFLCSQLFSWDYTIAYFNLNYAHTKDRQYLLELNKDALPLLVEDALVNKKEYSLPQLDYLLSMCRYRIQNKPSFVGWNLHQGKIEEACQRYCDLKVKDISAGEILGHR